MGKHLHGMMLLACVVLAALTLRAGAEGQGFMVKPMTMQANPSPTQTIELPLEIYNTAIDGPRTINLRLVDLSQDDQGTWQLVEPNSGVDLSGHASSLPWTTLSASSVDIGPQQPADIMVKLKPPASARGYYFAGIVAETPIPENATGVVVRVRFLIPLIIEIRGRTVAERIALKDVSMTYKTDAGTPPTTTAAMTIVNGGQTFSRVRGELTVERQNDKMWRVVTRLPVKERGIIPGVTLKLGDDLKRRLPSGTYRLGADLFVNGRRAAHLEKIVQFVGDPAATVAYDATLVLQPSAIDMKVVPGATRTTILSIENTGPDPVTIDMGARTPRGLLGVQMGNLVGTALSAEPWTKIEPSSFTLRGNGRQNVRVVSAVPMTGVSYPNYYADLVLDGKYADGQSAGETASTIHLDNAAIKSVPDGAIERVSMSEGDNSKFIAQLRFSNIGNVDFTPSADVSVLTAQGTLVASDTLSGDAGTLLPLGQRTFSGELDFSGVEPGDYSLVATVKIAADNKVTRKYVLTVKTEEFVSADGKKLSVPNVTLSDFPSGDSSNGAATEQDVSAPLGGSNAKN